MRRIAHDTLFDTCVSRLGPCLDHSRGKIETHPCNRPCRETTFTGHPDNIQLGDQHITSVELRDKNGMPVGTGAGVCTIVNTTTEPREQCLITAVFTNGQIIFGGLAPLLEVEAVGHFAILGGTDDFRKVRGEVTIIVTTLEKMDATFDLE